MRKTNKKTVSIALAIALTVTSISVGISENTLDAQAKTRKVYIAASGRGKCYHSSKYCSRMKGHVKKVTFKWAKKHKYRGCKKCA